jgi:hypothetical protein
MIAKARCHSPVFGLRQFSHRPAKPKGEVWALRCSGAECSPPGCRWPRDHRDDGQVKRTEL